MSLVQELEVTLKDLLPAGQAFVLTVPNVVAPYQISVRLHQVLTAKAKSEGVETVTVFRRLIDEVNGKAG